MMHLFMYGYSIKTFKNIGNYSKTNCCTKQYCSTKYVYTHRERSKEKNLRALTVAKII